MLACKIRQWGTDMRLLIYLLLGYAIGWFVRDYWQPARSLRARDAVPSLPVAHVQTADSLVEIQGIGPVFEQALRGIGITTFDDLARQDADALAEKLGGRVSAERIRRERWIEQARERANG